MRLNRTRVRGLKVRFAHLSACLQTFRSSGFGDERAVMNRSGPCASTTRPVDFPPMDESHPEPPFAGLSPHSPRYADDGRSVSALTYYVRLVTRRRRPFFADADVRARAEALLEASAAALGCRIEACAVSPSAVSLAVTAPPEVSPHVLVTRLRHDVAGPLKEEFEDVRRAGAVFVRRYLVSTVPIPEGDDEAFERVVSKA